MTSSRRTICRRSRTENDQLTQQIATYQSAYAELQTKLKNLEAASRRPRPILLPAQAQSQSQAPAWAPTTLQGNNPLDKPAYH